MPTDVANGQFICQMFLICVYRYLRLDYQCHFDVVVSVTLFITCCLLPILVVLLLFEMRFMH